MKYHFFYFLVLLLNGKYRGIYGGVHSTNNLNDGYLGSGTYVSEFKKLYGKESFLKFNTKFFKTREQALQYEKKVVNNEWVKSNYTLNKTAGGKGSTNTGSKSQEQKVQLLEKKLEKELKLYNSALD